MANELVQVPFHGDVIDASKDEAGNVWVPIRRPCEALGLAPNGQTEKLKGKAWANGKMILSLDAAGRQFEMYALSLDSLPMWLATIEASRVKPAVRPKLELYQREAAKVLADHFFGRRQANVTLGEQAMVIAQLVTAEVIPLVRAELAAISDRRREASYTIKDRLDALGWYTWTARHRDAIRHLALTVLRRRGYPMPVRESSSPAAELLFPESQVAILDEAITQVWDKVRAVEKRPHARQGAIPFDNHN